MWTYLGITFFFCLFILFAGNLLDIIIKEEISYFKHIKLNKFGRIFFFNRNNKVMINAGYYLDIIAYSLFVILNIINIIIGLMGQFDNYHLLDRVSLLVIYLFDLLVIYVVGNIIIYSVKKKRMR